MMLVAEKHGKILPEAQNHEDYLTSEVFGDLRYITPRYFWQPFFERTKSSTVDESPLTTAIGHPISDYARLQVLFWPCNPQYGEPDVVLRFSGGDHPALTVIVEVKLWSGKSGFDERDQLARYLRLLDALPSIGLPVSDDERRFLLYLTPRDSLTEIDESLTTLPDDDQLRKRVYRIQWQDLLEVARQAARTFEEPAATILSDIAEFLHRRNLEYFDGFCSDPSLDIGADDGHFYQSDNSLAGSFNGFVCVEPLESVVIKQGGWVEWASTAKRLGMRSERFVVCTPM